jgi:hypothetical protein
LVFNEVLPASKADIGLCFTQQQLRELLNMNKLSNKIGIALVTGLLAMGTVSTAYCAENAEGVAEYLKKSDEAAAKALTELQAGNVEAAKVELKNVRQFTKEITGQAASKKLQTVNQDVKETIRILNEEKDTKKAIGVLTPAVQSLHEINVDSKK